MTYLYETVPAQDGDPVKQYEIKQSMNDLPLTKHPETGETIRRVILGGWGIMTEKAGAPSSKSDCGCSPGGCC